MRSIVVFLAWLSAPCESWAQDALADTQYLTQLHRTLRNGEPRERLQAVQQIAKLDRLSRSDAVLILVGTMTDEDAGIRAAALRHLVRLHQLEAPAIVAIGGALRDKAPAVQRIAALALAGQHSLRQRFPEEVEKLFNHPDEMVRLRICEAIARERTGEQFLPALSRRCADANDEVRRAAIDAIIAMKSANPHPELVPVLAKAAQDHEVDVALGAVWALGELGRKTPQALPALKAHFDHPREEVRLNAIRALSKAGGESVPLLLDLLGHADSVRRRNAIRVLWDFDSTILVRYNRTATTMVKCLTDSDSEVRELSVRILGLFRAAAVEATPTLVELFRADPSPNVRSSAAATLRIVGRSAIPAVQPLRKSADPDVRDRAMSLLKALADSPD